MALRRAVPIVDTVVEQYTDDAPHLWILRDDAVKLPHYDLDDLAELDRRLEDTINGLRIAGDKGWELCQKALLWEGPGEVFTAAVLAFEKGDPEGVDVVIKVGSQDAENCRGLISALGWLPFSSIESWLRQMVHANSDIYRYISIAAYAIHRVDPGSVLLAAVNDSDFYVRARALRAIGELKRTDLLAELRCNLQVADEACRFWSAWSALLLGDHSAVEYIKPFFTSHSPFFERALQLVLRTMDITSAQNWLQGLAQFPDTLRYVICGAGIVGDPAYVPWIIKQMENNDVARVASEAFMMITGVDLAVKQLEGEWPEGFEAGPTENSKDADVNMDPDEDLPWPEPALVAQWWEQNKHRYQEGVRHLVGKPISEQQCRQLLKTGLQRQRIAAALELAILEPQEPLFEVRAPGDRQKRHLA